ncbi:MAG TPA: putative LPS assembly protein LptD, partial [Gemmatimonadaceae bacterium]
MLLWLAALTFLVPRLASAQVPPPPPDSAARRAMAARIDSLRQGGDTLLADSLARILADTLVQRRQIDFAPTDSVMEALLRRQGYVVTRYQGDTITFNSAENLLILRGQPSIVSRDSAVLVGESIVFNDSTQIIEARGDTLLLRDPARGPDDVIGRRLLRYNVRTREGIIREVTTTVESGERWIVHGGAGAFRGDTTGSGSSVFLARDGWLTSCTEEEPHYHFAAGEMKLIARHWMVARPAVLYIADIPVFWLPFIFQDIRSGRRSGIIAPRIGFSEIVRNNPSYRRHVEQFGYYFALTDYFDAQLTMDWRSGARETEGDPGWVKFSALTRYHIRDRFMSGELGASHHYLRDGSTNQQYSWNHRQEFSTRTSLTANLNYVTNTQVQRNTAFNPYTAMQTIQSQLNFNTGRGPFSLSLGGTQSQYPGRDQIDRSFPTLSITSKPIELASWFTWTPALRVTSQERLHIDQPGDFSFRYLPAPGGGVDSVAIDRSTRNTTISFDTPVEIAGFSWRNSFSVNDRLDDFPALRTIVDVNDTSVKTQRVFRRTFVTNVDWQTSFSLPSLFQGTWNVTPSMQIQKVDGGYGILVRTERTGGKFIAQPLRPS